MSNIFDNKRLRESTVASARLQSRFEDADISRNRLQRFQFTNLTEADKNLIKLQQTRLKKRRSGKGGKQQKKTRPRQGGGGRQPDIIDPNLERDLARQATELTRERDAASRGEAALERAAIDARVAEDVRLGDRRIDLEDRRLDLQIDELDNSRIRDRKERRLGYTKLDEDVRQFDADVRRAQENRAEDIARSQLELADVVERVARQDREEHRRHGDTIELARNELAARARDRELEFQSRGLDQETEQQRIRESSALERSRDQNRTDIERDRIKAQREVDSRRDESLQLELSDIRTELEHARHERPPPTLGGGLVEVIEEEEATPRPGKLKKIKSSVGKRLPTPRRSRRVGQGEGEVESLLEETIPSRTVSQGVPKRVGIAAGAGKPWSPSGSSLGSPTPPISKRPSRNLFGEGTEEAIARSITRSESVEPDPISETPPPPSPPKKAESRPTGTPVESPTPRSRRSPTPPPRPISREPEQEP